MKMNVRRRFFVQNLLEWNSQSNRRAMPWKGERDPYKIWLSEIILQQTRVEQGLGYYNRFISAFPTVRDLADASETEVFKLWEGLGYYTRCKNLVVTAKFIADVLNGEFPANYNDILALKGIGPYTAAAIGSFAFDLPHAVVDGNVFRVLARYFGIDTPIDTTLGKKLFTSLANDLLDKTQPANYNQALMDFGAVICKPQIPLCNNCVMNSRCMAYLEGNVSLLPIKEKSINKRDRWFYYLVINYNGTIYTRKRGGGDIWENLYEFILNEQPGAVTVKDMAEPWKLFRLAGLSHAELLHISENYKQMLTHQTIRGQFIHIKIKTPLQLKGFQPVSKKALCELPFPKFISNYLKDKNVSLNLFQNKKDQHSTEIISTI